MSTPDSPLTYLIQVVVPIITVVGGIVAYFLQRYLDDRSINKAILAEVNRLITAVRRHHDWWESLSEPKAEPLIPFSYAVYKENVKNIGVLQRSLVGAVVQFYGYLQFINDVQSKRLRFKKAADFEARYTSALKNFLDLFENRFDDEFEHQRWKLETQGPHTRWRM